MASSTELSTTSQMRWCRPLGPVDPMYMPGRLRTGSRPLRTVRSLAPYDAEPRRFPPLSLTACIATDAPFPNTRSRGISGGKSPGQRPEMQCCHFTRGGPYPGPNRGPSAADSHLDAAHRVVARDGLAPTDDLWPAKAGLGGPGGVVGLDLEHAGGEGNGLHVVGERLADDVVPVAEHQPQRARARRAEMLRDPLQRRP